ncbi:hypothetical protein [Pseudomonas sp. PLMAX]|uniref:hypothetical protein n=1 Tax=Pseudomonas sp. PLMAX TaxID=2201998 RepID=UPI0038B6DB4D
MKIDLITADTGPLIHLAAIGRLDLLKKVGHVQIPDLVVMEATVPGKPGSEEIREWIRQGIADGHVSMPETSTGELLRLARITKPDHRIKDGGERAILDWLIDNVEKADQSAMVVYENGKVPKLIQNHDSELHSAVYTTRAFLSYCELREFIPSAEKLWGELVGKVPTINQKKDVYLSGRLVDEGYKP